MSTAMMSEMTAILDAIDAAEMIADVLAESDPDPDESDLDYLMLAEAEWDLVADLDATDGEWDETDTAEFEAWLDSLAPSVEECEWRDAFLGHDA